MTLRLIKIDKAQEAKNPRSLSTAGQGGMPLSFPARILETVTEWMGFTSDPFSGTGLYFCDTGTPPVGSS
jgi:hypothetical protein